MKKKKLLTALIVGTLACVMTLGTTIPVYADVIRNITLQGENTGGDIWKYGYTEDDMLFTSNISMGRQDGAYTNWIGDNTQDSVTLKEGG